MRQGTVLGIPVRSATRLLRPWRRTALHRALERAHDESLRLNTEFQRGAQLQALSEVAGLAHELRNALSVVVSQVEIARVKAESLAPVLVPHLEVAGQGYESAIHILNNALKTACESSQEKVAVSLFDVARRILDLKSHDLCRDGITAQLEVPPDVPLVVGVRFELEQVLLNLVTNAHAALREASGPRAIAVVGLTEAAHAMLEVRDTGPGIAPEVLPRLFEPFYTTKANGTGLGLAISARIIHGLGGDLTAENRPEGGAVFRIRLPIAASSAVHRGVRPGFPGGHAQSAFSGSLSESASPR